MRKFGPETTAIVKQGVDRALAALTPTLAGFGFVPAKRGHWTRVLEHTVQTILVERDRDPPGMSPLNCRVELHAHSFIRVINDDSPYLCHNGIQSRSLFRRPLSYHLSFNAETDHQFERCVADMGDLISTHFIPWFSTYSRNEALLSSGSPLLPTEQERLRVSLIDGIDAVARRISFKKLGIKTTKDIKNP